jgi:hypothetical protein
MKFYRVYIVDPLQFVARENIMPVAEKLSAWFDPIVKKAGFDFSHVNFPQFIATPEPYELMVYICDYDQSVVQFAPGAAGVIQDPSTSPHKGVTLIGPPAASEVYLKNTNPLMIAALIFHELMHNKLQSGNSMHGNFSNAQMSAAMMTASADLAPSPEESAAMAKALKNRVLQWTDGQEMLWRAARKREKNDPMFDDHIRFKR